MRYKALSVVSPWGTRIAEGVKTIEVRSWITSEIALGSEDLLIVENGRLLLEEGDEDPNGRAAALVRVREMRAFTREDRSASLASRYEEGWFSWVLEEVRPIAGHIRVRAARKIYEVDVDLGI